MKAYGGFVECLSRKVLARLSDIEAVFNFDFGDEFEVAVCRILEDVLPANYGICRGFVVSESGVTAGDDLIIFNRATSPTLRAKGGLEYSVKEQIPSESVYAYIECKHSIDKADTLSKAISQARNVKKLLLQRQALQNKDYEEDGPVYEGKVRDWPRPLPPLKNQPFCMIIARQYGNVPLDTEKDNLTPDLLVLGQDHLAIHSVVLGPDGIKGALFFDAKHGTPLRIEKVCGTAWGVGLVTLLSALSWIELLPIDWTNTLNTAYFNALNGRK